MDSLGQSLTIISLQKTSKGACRNCSWELNIFINDDRDLPFPMHSFQIMSHKHNSYVSNSGPLLCIGVIFVLELNCTN